MSRTLLLLFAGCSLWAAPAVSILTIDNRQLEGQLSAKKIRLDIGGKPMDVAVEKILSIHSGAALSAGEKDRHESCPKKALIKLDIRP